MAVKCMNYLLCILKEFEGNVLRVLSSGGLPENVKTKLLEQLVKNIDVSSICRTLDTIGRRYYNDMIEGLRRLGYCVVDIVVSLDSRLVVGASGGPLAAVFEVGLSWDPVMGLPFVPGSSTKGVIRSWAVRFCLEKHDDSVGRRRCIEDFLALTGVGGEVLTKVDVEEYGRLLGLGGEEKVDVEEASAGLLFVADAYPVGRGRGLTGCDILVPDVLTPHYYRGGEPVQDEFEAQPNPVVHISIAEGTTLRFVFGVPRLDAELRSQLAGHLGLPQGADEARILFRIVSEAFMEGVGARTGKGYGFFNLRGMRLLHDGCAHAVSRGRRVGRVSWGRRG